MSALKTEVLAALQHIQQHGPTQREYGICCSVTDIYCQKYPTLDEGQLQEDTDAIDDLLTNLMSTWKHHSGSMAYPIPNPNGGSPSNFFWQMSVDKWDLNTPSGLLRLDLLNYTVDQLKIQLSKT